jgi:PBP1b-binding outer membrane lipoprotein LpoB
MKKYISLSVLLFLLNGCASTSNDKSANCPSNLSELDMLKAEAEVVQCFGDSVHETSKPDGRHTRMYKFSGNISTVFVFDKDGNVIRNRSYKE